MRTVRVAGCNQQRGRDLWEWVVPPVFPNQENAGNSMREHGDSVIQKAWKFFCSVKLTVVLFVLILVPSIIGTIIQQNAPDPGRYVEVYGPAWDAVFRSLGFYDVYHSPYFVVLLVLLGLNTFVCTLNRFRPKWRLVGMLMTHCGLLLILVGAFVGAVFGVKGFMVIEEGETTDAMTIGRSNRPTATLPRRRPIQLRNQYGEIHLSLQTLTEVEEIGLHPPLVGIVELTYLKNPEHQIDPFKVSFRNFNKFATKTPRH